jgi:hypothetical protein
MNYLFFDIECANCFDGVGKICEFGYVLTDEKFSVIEENSFKMNPRAVFDKKGFAMRGIHLEHPFAFYKTQPDFPYFYPKIRGYILRNIYRFQTSHYTDRASFRIPLPAPATYAAQLPTADTQVLF